MLTIVCPRLVFRRMLRALIQQPGQVAWARVAASRAGADTGWLVRDFAVQPTAASGPPPTAGLALRVSVSNELRGAMQVASLPRPLVGALIIGDGALRGRVWGVVKDTEDQEPEPTLCLVGAGMHRIPIFVPGNSRHNLVPQPLTGFQKTAQRHPPGEELQRRRRPGNKPIVPTWNVGDEPWNFEYAISTQPPTLGSQSAVLRPRAHPFHEPRSSRRESAHSFVGERDSQSRLTSAATVHGFKAPTIGSGNSHPDPNRDRWSRNKGALGGEAVWQRLVALRIGIVGCGRSGSLLATALASLGIRTLVLIDADSLEEHNLGEMDLVTADDLGRPKVEALAERLMQRFDHLNAVVPVPSSVSSREGLQVLKDCDVLCCCADNDAARLTTAIVAALYHKVFLDVGVGIRLGQATTASNNSKAAPSAESPKPNAAATHPPGAELSLLSLPLRIMGADVRLIVPGDGCLLCRGNLSNYQQAVEDLCARQMTSADSTNWRMRRAGSARSLNQIATGLLTRLLEDLIAERITHSVWAHLDCDQDGRFTMTYPQPPANPPACALCAKAGLGDAGLTWNSL